MFSINFFFYLSFGPMKRPFWNVCCLSRRVSMFFRRLHYEDCEEFTAWRVVTTSTRSLLKGCRVQSILQLVGLIAHSTNIKGTASRIYSYVRKMVLSWLRMTSFKNGYSNELISGTELLRHFHCVQLYKYYVNL